MTLVELLNTIANYADLLLIVFAWRLCSILGKIALFLQENRRPSGLDRPPFLSGRREGSAPDERKM